MDLKIEKSKVEFYAPRLRKTDSARWRDRTMKPLSYAQHRIKVLCEGFLKGQVSSEEFKRELPPILNARDREKRNMAL